MHVDDPIRGSSEPDRCWTLTNVGEASPLVLTALEWSIWGEAVELGARGAFHDFGFLPASEVRESTVPDERITGCFYGRQAMNVDLTREIMGQIPGSSADDYERDMLGSVRPDARPVPNSLRRLPAIAVRAPRTVALQRSRVARRYRDQLDWWQREVFRPRHVDPHALLEESTARFVASMRDHVRSRTLLQGFQAQVTNLCADIGDPELALTLLAGYGQVTETSIAHDLWEHGAGRLPLEEFLSRHGFHGPNEGNQRSHSWREDPAQVAPMARSASGRTGAAPRSREAASTRRRLESEATLMAALPRHRRGLARLLLRSAGQQVRNLELGKGAYTTAIDGGRRAARDLGALLVERGRLSDPELVFHLTRNELHRGSGDGLDLEAIATARAALHADYESHDLPVTFVGMPDLTAAEEAPDLSLESLAGAQGASGSVVGRVRVIDDPDAADDLEEGEILVCRTTDPGWAPLFSLAAGLVIDIGGPASHGAIVAREMGIPCVIGTGHGTSWLRTGDLVTVDGSAGRVTRVAEDDEDTGTSVG